MLVKKRHRNTARTAYLVVALVVMSLFAAYYVVYKPAQKPSKEPSFAIEIIDGDTFRDALGETIRLLGIDTPEEGQPYYREATVFLDSMLKRGGLRYELDHRKRDKYGRLLAYIFADGRFVNAELVRSGLAMVYIHSDRDMKNQAYRRLLIENQKYARENHLHIWSLPAPEPEEYYIGNRSTLCFHRPNCRSAKSLKPENRLILHSRDEFLDLGYSPCRNCRP